MTQLTQERALELFSYDPETGVVVRKVSQSRNPKAKAGCIAGSRFIGGYLALHTDGQFVLLHRLIFLMMTGSWPAAQVDHINGVRDDNRWCNLRATTHQENLRNQKRHSTNKTGIMGVSWCNRRLFWRARIKSKDKEYHLGYFDGFFEACCARKSAENIFGYHPNHGAR